VVGAADPFTIGQAVGRLGSAARRHGKVPLTVLAAVLSEGDVVERVVVGRFRNTEGVAAMLAGEVVLVNGREWDPEVVRIGIGPNLQVQGQQDGRHATLWFTDEGVQEVIDQITDPPLAVEFAQWVRHKAAGG